MKTIKFIKMVASGNDFILLDAAKCRASNLGKLAVKICHRISGAGADGLLVLEKDRKADVRMRIFNPDGSEAEMCANGSRCTCLYWAKKTRRSEVSIATIAGRIEGRLAGDRVKIRLTDPRGLRLGLRLRFKPRALKVDYIDTGVPHAIVPVEGIDKIDVKRIGRDIRFHGKFTPKGTNVDFLEVVSKNRIKVRTYERGVEDETLSCGTGMVASAIIAGIKLHPGDGSMKMDVLTKGGERLKVYFKKINTGITDVWLEGKAGIVYGGQYYV